MRTSIRSNTIRKLVLNQDQTAAVIASLEVDMDDLLAHGTSQEEYDTAEFLASLITQIKGKNLTIEVWG